MNFLSLAMLLAAPLAGQPATPSTPSAPRPLAPAPPSALAGSPADTFAALGSLAHAHADHTWHDAARQRDVPVRIYTPTAPAGTRLPVVVFSHGAGGSREGYAYAATHLASRGYLVILPQHAGSDTPALRGSIGADDADKQAAFRDRLRERVRQRVRDKLTGGGDGKTLQEGSREDFSRVFQNAAGGPLDTMINDPANLENRPRDVSFVIDEVARRPELAAICDLSRVGVAGHSFGAYTSLAAAGLRVKVGDEDRSWPDPRIRAAVAMSPQGTGTMGIHAGSWDAITVPVLCLTGTKDMGQGQRAAAWRREIMTHIKAPTTFIEITDANHMTFAISKDGLSDSERVRGGVYNEEHNRLIRLSLAAFMDAYLKGDAAARVFVEGEGLADAARVGATMERSQAER